MISTSRFSTTERAEMAALSRALRRNNDAYCAGYVTREAWVARNRFLAARCARYGMSLPPAFTTDQDPADALWPDEPLAAAGDEMTLGSAEIAAIDSRGWPHCTCPASASCARLECAP